MQNERKREFTAPAPFRNDSGAQGARKKKKNNPQGRQGNNPAGQPYSGIPTRKIVRGRINRQQKGMANYGFTRDRRFIQNVPTQNEQMWAKLQRHGLLSPCAKLYAKALVNPFGNFDGLPCIPDLIATPSFKFAARATGIMTIGTTQVGFITINPFAMVTSAKQKVPGPVGAGSNLFQPAVYATTAAYNKAGVFIPQSNLATDPAGWISSSSDSPFDSIDVKLKIRLVGCGVKTRYMGKELDRAGRVILYSEPSNVTIGAGQLDLAGNPQVRGAWQNIVSGVAIPISSLMNNKSTTMTVASRKVQFVNYKCAAQEDLSYKNFYATDAAIVGHIDTYASWGGNASISSVGVDPNIQTASPRYSLLYYVDGGTAGSAWEFETIAFFEVTGTDLPNLTASHSDPIGMSAVMGAIPVRHTTESPEAAEKAVIAQANQDVNASSGLGAILDGAMGVASTFGKLMV